jgi:RNA-directed DNA polymerase
MIRSSGHLTAGQLIRRLNPLLRGWTSYHRHACSSATFFHVDRAIAQSLWQWVRRRHRQKSAAWLGKTYFPVVRGGATAFRGEVLRRDGRRKTVFLLRPIAVPIRRHVPLWTGANPYDPAWESYFEARLQRRVESSLTGPSRLYALWQEQQGRCPVCQQPLSPEQGWHLHHREWLVYGGGDDWDNLVLLHPNCHRQVHTLGLQVDKAASREGRS